MYHIFSSVSTVLLEHVFFYVWGIAPVSVGKYSYYVSLLIILVNSPRSIFLRSVLMFIKSFLTFSNLRNASLIGRLKPCKLIGVVNIKNSIVYFTKLVSCFLSTFSSTEWLF
jgi:hypothetical protein